MSLANNLPVHTPMINWATCGWLITPALETGWRKLAGRCPALVVYWLALLSKSVSLMFARSANIFRNKASNDTVTNSADDNGIEQAVRVPAGSPYLLKRLIGG